MLSSIFGISTAYAQYSTTTAGTQVTTMINDTAATFSSAIAVILGILAALTALGFIIRKFRKHVTGKKF